MSATRASPGAAPERLDLDALSVLLAARERRTFRIPGFRRAAVLVPLLVDEDQGVAARLLYTVRPTELRNHAGQISFPGGKRDDRDADEIATALRETHEEIGVPAGAVRVLGLLDDVPTPSRYIITPVVGVVSARAAITPSPGEVAEVFLATLDELDAGHRMGDVVDFLGFRVEMPEFHHGPHRIWGATARMTFQLRELLRGREAPPMVRRGRG